MLKELYLQMAQELIKQVKILGSINQEYFRQIVSEMGEKGAELFLNEKEELDEIFRNSGRILSFSEELDTIVSKILSLNSSALSIAEERKEDKGI